LEYDAVVVGAGTTGLVAAKFLAEAGYKVLVVELKAEERGRDKQGVLREDSHRQPPGGGGGREHSGGQDILPGRGDRVDRPRRGLHAQQEEVRRVVV